MLFYLVREYTVVVDKCNTLHSKMLNLFYCSVLTRELSEDSLKPLLPLYMLFLLKYRILLHG